MTSMEGKGVVISGGTTGIGRATALRLSAQGANVLIFGRHNRELVDALADIRPNAKGKLHGMTADQSAWDDMVRVFQEADRHIGNVDVVINNAGLSAESVTDTDPKEWKYIVDTNLLGYMSGARLAVDRMKPKGTGHIVNVGSMSAQSRGKGADIYVATKCAIQGFSDSLRKSVAEHGIRVSLVEPGEVGTDMSDADPEEQRKCTAAHEMLMAEDIAECIYYILTQPQRCNVTTVQIEPLLDAR